MIGKRKFVGTRKAAEPDADDKGGNWIAGAVKHPGALHAALNVPQGKKIPPAKIKAAANSPEKKLAQRARFAETMAKIK